MCNDKWRNNSKNDFTFVANRGTSVVDYAVVPHDLLQFCEDFEVIRPRVLYTTAGCNGTIDPVKANIPDHSFLKWKVKQSMLIKDVSYDMQDNVQSTVEDKFKVTNIPEDFMEGNIKNEIENVIHTLQQADDTQHTINQVFDTFTNLVYVEMTDKLEKCKVSLSSDSFRKKNRQHKAWWHTGLTDLWNDLCKAEKLWIKAPPPQKNQYKALMKTAQRAFNREVQRAKRNYWYDQQVQLMKLCDEDQTNFWKKIGKIGIGQDRNKKIPLEVTRMDGTVSTNIQDVKDKWLTAFQTLLNPVQADNNLTDMDIPIYPEPLNSEMLNADIAYEEVVNTLKEAKNGKAVGVDKVPTEVLKNKTCAIFMTHLFNACFKSGVIPEIWGRGIITPVLKDPAKDHSDPGNYRGLSIAPSMYKLYCGVLNHRLSKYVRENDYIVDEQNGFQKDKSTVDHLITFTNILETRKLQKKDTFVAYIDFSKAYDRVNRGFLWNKLQSMGINGKMLTCIKSLYSNVSACVKLRPSEFTNWFRVSTGLRQGCLLSPLLFNVYINDLAMAIKEQCNGIEVGDSKICLSMYADDLVLLADTEKDLQKMLATLDDWCKKWDVLVNSDKSQVVHFRAMKKEETMCDFVLGGVSLAKVAKYKYLGLVIDYKLEYKTTAEAIAKSASRALGLLISKAKSLGGLSYNCFSKLYESNVIPIIRYGAAIWGHKEYSCINAVHNRMCRFYLGVGKFTPNAAVQGDMGLRTPWQHQKLEVCRQWCRLINMSNERMNKKVFLWCNEIASKNWNFKVKQFLTNLNREEYTEVDSPLESLPFIQDISECMEILNEQQWLEIINKEEIKSKKGKNKLRTYNTFKSSFNSEPYVYNIMPKSHRSAYAQFRCGTAPIKLETGRYEGLPVERRTCPLCNNGVEDECHVLLVCPYYDAIRIQLFQQLSTVYDDFYTLSNSDMLKCILGCKDDKSVKLCAKACHNILRIRKQNLYK